MTDLPTRAQAEVMEDDYEADEPVITIDFSDGNMGPHPHPLGRIDIREDGLSEVCMMAGSLRVVFPDSHLHGLLEQLADYYGYRLVSRVRDDGPLEPKEADFA